MFKTSLAILFFTALPLLAQPNPYQSDIVSWGGMQLLDGCSIRLKMTGVSAGI